MAAKSRRDVQDRLRAYATPRSPPADSDSASSVNNAYADSHYDGDTDQKNGRKCAVDADDISALDASISSASDRINSDAIGEQEVDDDQGRETGSVSISVSLSRKSCLGYTLIDIHHRNQNVPFPGLMRRSLKSTANRLLHVWHREPDVHIANWSVMTWSGTV